MKRLFTTLTVASLMAMTASAYTLDVTPGALAGLLPEAVSDGVLLLRGTADARDIVSLSELPAGVKTLDMSELKIVELRSSQPVVDGRTYFPADEIPEYSFFKSAASSIILPADIRTVGDGAFAHSSLTSITLPAGLTSMGAYAFYGCSDLADVVLPGSLTSLGTGSFGNCPRLGTMDFRPTKVSLLPERVLAGCTTLQDVKIGASVSSIGSEAFENTAVTELDLSGVKTLADFALAGMSRLKSVTLRNGASIGKGLLMDDTALQSVEGYPDAVPTLFAANCRLLNPSDMLDSATGVGNYAFANIGADTLVFGSDLKSVGERSFAGLDNLQFIDARALDARVPDVAENTFAGINPADVTLYVALATPEIWRDHPVWGEFNVMDDTSVQVPGVSGDASEITIGIRAGYLMVEAPEALESVAIYTADGRTAGLWHPDTPSAAISLGDLPEGIILVKASTAGDSRSVKMMTR
ncbi:MAG: leucine-rich repeat domain-containing protein [Muribaculaceae bacterium]|nr:leucine-rich repeat domain-containing protein [Muribaculaceae bacterium]